MESDSVIKFVPLFGFEDDYEIMNEYPFMVRNRKTGNILKESNTGSGYPRVNLHRKSYNKHQLIAKQFIPNPDNLPEIDHINHDRTDYHLENLRWISHVDNMNNLVSSRNRTKYEYVDEIPIDSIKVDFYESKGVRHEFNNYYYCDGVFYYDNDVNYKIVHININSINCKTISIRDINKKKVNIVVNRFLKQHDLL